jgi:hypothetical protein
VSHAAVAASPCDQTDEGGWCMRTRSIL